MILTPALFPPFPNISGENHQTRALSLYYRTRVSPERPQGALFAFSHLPLFVSFFSICLSTSI